MAEMKKLIEGVRDALVEIERRNKDLIVVSGDLLQSTGVDEFQKLFPERCLNDGVAEEDLVSFAAGLSGIGKERKPVVLTSFGSMAGYLGFGQYVQSVCMNDAWVISVLTHNGVNVGADGASHQATLTVALMRILPKMKVAMPADYYETKAILKETLKIPGPYCILLPREAGRIIYDQNVDFQFGKSQVRYFGKKPKILLIACGLMVAEAIETAEVLRKKGLPTIVLNASSIKPLDSKKILNLSRQVERIFTIEEQSIFGGLGGAVCELLSGEEKHSPITRLGIPDVFGQSGTREELWDHFGLSGEKIAEAVLRSFS